MVPNPAACLVCDFELNRVLEATLDVVDSADYPFALFGINLKKGLNFSADSAYVDLSDLEALSFFARGQGTLRIQFLTKTGLDQTENNAHFVFEVQLSQRWQQFFVVAADLQPIEYNGQSYPWSESSSDVWGISFLGIEDGTVWIDHISLEGVDLSNFDLP